MPDFYVRMPFHPYQTISTGDNNTLSIFEMAAMESPVSGWRHSFKEIEIYLQTSNFNEICESTANVNFMYFLFQNERQAYSTSGLDSSLFVIICIGVSNVIQIKLPTARS